MIERFLAGDSTGWIEGEESGEEVESERVGLRVEVREGNPRLDGEGANVFLSLEARSRRKGGR